MQKVAIVGCGIVGAMIAYELSQIPDLSITVFDRQPPAQAATGAALGVLMGIISQKTKGRAWAMRQASIQRYVTLIPELEAAIGQSIPYNSQGIVMLRFQEARPQTAKPPDWQTLAEIRRAQGWTLELWERDRLQSHCPHIVNPRITGAVYSPQDAQVDPTALTLALVAAAQQKGVTFRLDAAVKGFETACSGLFPRLQFETEEIAVDWLIIAAGLGSTLLSQLSPQPIAIQPVLGQALRVQLAQPLGDLAFQPVISGEDIHIVPLGNNEYWIGATVEFPPHSIPPSTEAIIPDPAYLETVWQGAIALCPALADATILETWSGLRPRPQNRPAPIVEPLAGYQQVLLATGHYRNGVLLAPATAQQIRAMITAV
ncbi:FAD-binding oxidoreductase [Phormidium tenue FACHB-886]|nr:FAD-binding oxidoreductase [Phormidium tenue FACHB-886]